MKPFSFLAPITSLEGLVVFILWLTLIYYITGLLSYCMLCYTHLLLKKVIGNNAPTNKGTCQSGQDQIPPMRCTCGKQVDHDPNCQTQDRIQCQQDGFCNPYEVASSIPPYGIRLTYFVCRFLSSPFFAPPPPPWKKQSQCQHDKAGNNPNN